ncbi:MAG: hypothetical protein AB7O38_11945, partial [Pirellulaceae bacterium]
AEEYILQIPWPGCAALRQIGKKNVSFSPNQIQVEQIARITQGLCRQKKLEDREKRTPLPASAHADFRVYR